MENLRKITKIKLIVMLLSMTLPIAVVLVMALGRFEKMYENSIFLSFQPLPYILAVLVEAYLAYKNYRYVKILKDDEYAEYILIKKNDERNKTIYLHTNALVHKIFMYILGIALILTAFMNAGYFYIVLSLVLSFLVVHVVVAIYYHKKY